MKNVCVYVCVCSKRIQDGIQGFVMTTKTKGREREIKSREREGSNAKQMRKKVRGGARKGG
jgi:hypothetical protein